MMSEPYPGSVIYHGEFYPGSVIYYDRILSWFCYLSFIFTLIYLILETCQLMHMGENVLVLVIFGTCDVMFNLSISLLPPIVHDNLFACT